MSDWRLLVVLPLLGLLSTSCGRRSQFKECFPVRGQVFYGGKAAPKGTIVVFHSAGEEEGPGTVLPRGTVEEDGSFVVTTYKYQDGAPPGDYQVAILHFQGKELSTLLPARYQNHATSGLQVHIDKRNNEIEPFELLPEETPPTAP